MSRKKVDSKEVGLELGLVLGRYFLKTDDLHYGYWPEDLEVDVVNFPKAQKNYSDFIFSHIPEGTQKILDVGSGSGNFAKRLIDNKFLVDCVSPSKYLTNQIHDKLGDSVEVFPCIYEDVQTEKRYDLILFSESFQYINIRSALDICSKLLSKNGNY